MGNRDRGRRSTRAEVVILTADGPLVGRPFVAPDGYRTLRPGDRFEASEHTTEAVHEFEVIDPTRNAVRWVRVLRRSQPLMLPTTPGT